MDCQAPGVIGEIVGFDLLDEGAVVVLVQRASDGVLEVEAFAEDEGGHSPKRDFPHVRRQRIDGRKLTDPRAIPCQLQLRQEHVVGLEDIRS